MGGNCQLFARLWRASRLNGNFSDSTSPIILYNFSRAKKISVALIIYFALLVWFGKSIRFGSGRKGVGIQKNNVCNGSRRPRAMVAWTTCIEKRQAVRIYKPRVMFIARGFFWVSISSCSPRPDLVWQEENGKRSGNSRSSHTMRKAA